MPLGRYQCEGMTVHSCPPHGSGPSKLRTTKRSHLLTQGVIIALDVTVIGYSGGQNTKRVQERIKKLQWLLSPVAGIQLQAPGVHKT